MSSRGAPTLPARHVRRSRLTRLLDETAARAILVVAPAGYGKTMLAAEWAQAQPHVAWFRVTSASADLSGFVLGLAESLQAIVPIDVDRVRTHLATSPTASASAAMIVGDREAWPAGSTVIVDDYHLVRDEAVDAVLDALVATAPVRLLVATRQRPRWASARKVLYGELAEIGRDHLAMTEDEAERVLCGKPPESIAALVAQAHGWPAVIGLAALAMASDAPPEAVEETLYRYFAEEVLNRESAEIRRYMLHASIAPEVDASEGGVTHVVERLVDEGILTHEGGHVRFHPLLRDFLRRRLRELDPRRADELLVRAIGAARRRRSWEEAFELAEEAGSVEAAVEVACEAAPEFVATGRITTVERWLEFCGAAALRHPELVLAKLAVLFHHGRFSDAAALGRDLAERLGPADPRTSGAWYRRAQALHLLADRGRALDAARKACETAVTPLDRRRALLLAALTAARLELGETDEHLAALSRMDADVADRLRYAAALLVAEVKKGDLSGVWERVQPLVALSDHVTSPMLRSHVLATAGYLHVLRGDYALAAKYADEALGLCREFSIDFAIDFCLVCRALADIGLRRFKPARERLQEARRRGVHREDQDIHLQRLIANLKLDLARGLQGARTLPPHRAEGATAAYLGEHIALVALAAATSGDVRAALTSVEKVRGLTRSAEAVFYADFAELVARIEEGTAAADDVGELVVRVSRAEVLDAFVVAYRAYPALLALAGRDPAARAAALHAVAQAHDWVLAQKARLVESPQPDGPSELTPREAEVLSLMGEGRSNAEIAERLVISVNTTKVHVHNILRKLGASTRVEAVVHAKGGMADRAPETTLAET